MSMRECAKLAANLDDADTETLVNRADGYMRAGLAQDVAQRMAATDALAEVEREHAELMSLAREQHPDRFAPEPDPVPQFSVRQENRKLRRVNTRSALERYLAESASALDAWRRKGEGSRQQALLLGPQPHVLHMRGAPMQILIAHEAVLRKVFVDKHADAVANLGSRAILDGIYQPAAVVRSSRAAGEFEILTPIGRDGGALMVAVATDVPAGDAKATVIKSAHAIPFTGKGKTVESMLADVGRLEYADLAKLEALMKSEAPVAADSTPGPAASTVHPAQSGSIQRGDLPPGGTTRAAARAAVPGALRDQKTDALLEQTKQRINTDMVDGFGELVNWIGENYEGPPAEMPRHSRGQGESPWYSELERRVEAAQFKAAPAKAWLDWLKGLQSKGVKPDEIAWSGIEEWLALQGAKVTREQVAEFLAGDGVRVTETVLGPPQGQAEFVARLEALPMDELRGEAGDAEVEGADGMTRAQLVRAIVNSYEDGMPGEGDRSPGDTKYGQYTLPGGTNYREVLLTLPAKSTASPERAAYEQWASRNGLTPNATATEDRYNRETGLAAPPPRTMSAMDADAAQNYRSSHWDQPNVLAHIRLNDRTDASGARVLFVEEIQSDWGQEGKKRGFAGTPQGAAKNNGMTLAEWEALSPEDRAFTLEESRNSSTVTVPAAPFVTNTDKWVTLALKRVIKLAVDGGYDKVAFITGEQSAERYDLSKHIDTLLFDPGDGTVIGRKGGANTITRTVQRNAEIADVVGKEIAERLLAAPKNGYGMHELAGVDLQVGGEGMRAFYNKIVPSVLKDVLRKVGGGALDAVALDRAPTAEELALAKEYGYENAPPRTWPGFTITPSMRERAAGGMPLFSRQQEGAKPQTLADDLAQQQTFLAERARAAGFDNLDLWVAADFMGFMRAATEWREAHPADVLQSRGQGVPPGATPGRGMLSPAQPTWALPDPSRLDAVLYALQDKQIDLKRVVEEIKKTGAQLNNRTDAYLREELYHGRVAARTDDFLNLELRPLLEEMRLSKVSMPELERFLHARHAKERNAAMAKVNPGMRGNDALSGMSDAEAAQVLAGATPALMRLAARVDAMIEGTRDLMVNSGLESQDTIDTLRGAYKHYVPLYREDMQAEGRPAIGQGMSVRGSLLKRATGSDAGVVDILAHIVMEREATVTRAEKNLVGQALYALALRHQNKDWWTTDIPPKRRAIGPQGTVVEQVVPTYKTMENVLVLRVNGEDRIITFNERNERAMRMALALKNLDQERLNTVMRASGVATRWLAAVNTQYNPVFAIVNAVRDVQGSMVNLGDTAIAGKQRQVLAAALPALRAIWRAESDPQAAGQWESLYHEFRHAGAKTGWRASYETAADRNQEIVRELESLDHGGLRRLATGTLELLSVGNTAIENAMRLAAYKVALDSGLSKDRAASIAKNLTVNFNRKGAYGAQAGSLYAFFNAAVQGTARMAQAINGPAGRKIVLGGLAIGVMQALALAGLDDEDRENIPDFVKERSLVIPLGDGRFAQIPMPLGLHVIPNIGRVLTEAALDVAAGRDVNATKAVGELLMTAADAFNPLGGAQSMIQLLSPTPLDPLVGLSENQDAFGRPIYRERSDYDPAKPGFALGRDNTSPLWKGAAYIINALAGGDEFARNPDLPDAASPQPEALRFIAESIGGGVWRESERAIEAVISTFTGVPVESHRLPLLSRFLGDLNSTSAPVARFYDNMRELDVLRARVRGLEESEHPEAQARLDRLVADHPVAALTMDALDARRELRALHEERRELAMAGDMDAAALKDVEERIAELMRDFNARVRKAKGGDRER